MGKQVKRILAGIMALTLAVSAYLIKMKKESEAE